MLVSELELECALHVHDADFAELYADNWLAFIKSAARDARSSGWLVHLEENESTTVASNDYDYDVPASFAYIERLVLEETINGSSVYIRDIPRGHWDIRYDGGVAVIHFDTLTSLVVDKKIKVIGQRRPTIYVTHNDVIDPGMEGFLRERAIFFGFRYLGAGMSELAKWRQQMATTSWQVSEMMLRRHPQEFRALPNSIQIPGRE